VTVDRLTWAAAELADEVGLAKVTVSALARRFGVQDASLYSHIRNIQELRFRVAALALDELADQVAAALAGRAGKEALVAFADTYRAYATRHRGRYAATQLELHEPAAPVVSAARRHADLTRAMLRGYRLAEPDETDAVRMLHSALHGFLALEAASGFDHHPRPVDASWARTLDALHVALSSWPRPSGEPGVQPSVDTWT
jgi:AcrR family transcriptional regulator